MPPDELSSSHDPADTTDRVTALLQRDDIEDLPTSIVAAPKPRAIPSVVRRRDDETTRPRAERT
ncbi:MAG TPA: hypothetical protein VLX92_31290, partial [Kofleriaceae bacterium]|nr:hypothetical protein [Kofleriaceae bacterium]